MKEDKADSTNREREKGWDGGQSAMKDMATAVIFSNQFSEAVIRNTSLKMSLLKNPPKKHHHIQIKETLRLVSCAHMSTHPSIKYYELIRLSAISAYISRLLVTSVGDTFSTFALILEAV